jgi:hypothetical protein
MGGSHVLRNRLAVSWLGVRRPRRLLPYRDDEVRIRHKPSRAVNIDTARYS